MRLPTSADRGKSHIHRGRRRGRVESTIFVIFVTFRKKGRPPSEVPNHVHTTLNTVYTGPSPTLLGLTVLEIFTIYTILAFFLNTPTEGATLDTFFGISIRCSIERH